jgi:hypothetical protein
MVYEAPITDDARLGVLTIKDLDRLTSLSFTALTELRHRGAFSAVAQGFAACCARNQKEGREDILLRLYEVTFPVPVHISLESFG